MWDVKTFKDKKLKSPVLIEGLPGIANVGKIVADYLVDQFNAEKIMSFSSYDLPNSVFVNEDALVELPKIELYHKKIGGKDFLFLCGDVQPNNEKASYVFTEKILGIAKKYGCREIVTLGGIGLAEVPVKPKVYCTANQKSFLEKFRKSGASTKVYGMVGPIIGVSGLLVGMSRKESIKGVALLAETYGHPMFLGLQSAKETLRVLSKAYNLKIDYKEINKEIKLFEKEMKGEDVSDEKSSMKRLKKIKEISYIG